MYKEPENLKAYCSEKELVEKNNSSRNLLILLKSQRVHTKLKTCDPHATLNSWVTKYIEMFKLNRKS